MALHRNFPRSPYEVLSPDLRWFPAAEELRSTAYEKLLPPLVANVREQVKAWRDANYAGASATSRALLTWWFETAHTIEQADATESEFRYYFAQREAVETVIWLYDAKGVRDKFDLLRFDASGAVSGNMFDEDWPRFVVKMATGAGKTKVFQAASAFNNVDVVKGFLTGQSDKFDINDIVDFNPMSDQIADFLTLTNSGGNTQMLVDRDGTGGTYSSVQVALLEGVTDLDAEDLLAGGYLIAA